MLIFWEFHWNSWVQYQKKSENMFFRWKRRQIKQNEKFSYFGQNQLYRKAIAYDKIGGNYALSANSTKICLLGYFYMQNWYLRWKQLKIIWFSRKMHKNRKMNNFGNFCNFLRFSLKLLSKILEKVRIYVFLDGKEDK